MLNMDMLMRKTVASGSASRYLPAQRWRPRRKRSRSFAPKLASAKAGTSGRDARSAAQYIGEARSFRSLSPAAGGSPKGRLAASSSAGSDRMPWQYPNRRPRSERQRLLVRHSWRIARNSSVREPSRHAAWIGKDGVLRPNVRAERNELRLMRPDPPTQLSPPNGRLRILKHYIRLAQQRQAQRLLHATGAAALWGRVEATEGGLGTFDQQGTPRSRGNSSHLRT